jgi:hypothetical protein
MSALSTFAQYNKLAFADQLIEKVSKDDLAECARLLALNVAHYESKYGDLPLDETLAMIGMATPNEEQLQLMTMVWKYWSGYLETLFRGSGRRGIERIKLTSSTCNLIYRLHQSGFS